VQPFSPSKLGLADATVNAVNAVHDQSFSLLKSVFLGMIKPIDDLKLLFLGRSPGCSDDWYTSEGVRYVYAPELRDNGFGFLLPPEQIIPSGEEIWAGWEVMLNQVLENNGL